MLCWAQYFFLVIAALASAQLHAAEAEVDFVHYIKPILESSCVKCHGADRFHGDLRLDTKELALQSFGETGRLIVPGQPEKSTLYTTTVLPDSDPIAMPLRDRDSLSKEQSELLRLWIKQGAKWPDDVVLKRIDKVTFSFVGSVLQQSCLQCHQDGKTAGGLNLETKLNAFKGGNKGAAIVPYDAAASPLFTTLVSPSVHDKNPPRLLTDDDVRFIRDWINQGAVWPDEMKLEHSKR